MNPERHDWTGFDALEVPEPDTVRAAIVAGDGWQLMKSTRYGAHARMAWTPRDFVALWQRGYR